MFAEIPSARGSSPAVTVVSLLEKLYLKSLVETYKFEPQLNYDPQNYDSMVEKKANEKGNQHILTGGQIVTRKDLEEFKQDILQEIHKLLRPINRDTTKKWLKSREVRKMLDISPGKLYLLRANRQLGFMRIVGVIYYDHEDIEKMLNVSKPRCLNEKSRIVTTNGFGRQIPPIWHQVVVYFSQQAASNRQAIAFFKYYRCRRWLSDRGKPIKNWKKLAWTWIWYKA